MSVYNKEMLSKNRLPLVNGFSQLVVSRDYEREEEEETSPRDGEEDASSGGAGGRRHGHRQPPPPPHTVETPAGVVGVAAGRGQQPHPRPQQGSAVPATLSQRSGASTGGGGGGKDEGEGTVPTNRDQLEALTNYAVGRVKKQVEITKQVAEELTKLTPGKLREAAVVQANKVQEMPTLLMDTSKRMVASGKKFVRNYIDEQDRKK